MATYTGMEEIELDKRESMAPTVVPNGYDEMEAAARHGSEHDRNDLIRVGKRPVLFRNFGFMSILGFICTALSTWETSLIVINTGLSDGGPSTIIYGFILAWVGAAAIYASLCELASMAPTSGGQYHWVSMLAPESCRNILSYITGWLTVIGWQANLAGGFFISAAMIEGIVILNYPDIQMQPWQTVLLYWAVIVYSLLINGIISKMLPVFESIILVLHILGWPAIFFPMIFLSNHAEPSTVFNNFTNEGNLPTVGLAFVIGLSGNVLGFTGGDSAIHMSEEIRGATKTVPRAVMTGVLINGSLAFGMLIATLFSASDLDAAASSPTGYAFMEIFYQATGSLSGSTTMIAIMLILQFSCTVGLTAAASRMTWSFARDKGLPGARWMAYVHPRTGIPIVSVLITAFISVLFSLIIFGSTTAFNNIISISISGLYASYLVAIGWLLYRRLAGHIQDDRRYEGDVVNTVGSPLVWGQWRMPKVVGAIVNAYACVWCVFEIFFNFWPLELPVTAQNMQYSVVVTVGVTLLATVWYFIGGKRHYKGPIIETEK